MANREAGRSDGKWLELVVQWQVLVFSSVESAGSVNVNCFIRKVDNREAGC